MELKLYTAVHPIDGDNPWAAPAGWRWAIHSTPDFHQVESGCINASWQPSQGDAKSELSMVVISIRRAMTIAGIKCTVEQSVLADCPLTADIVAELAVLQ